MRYTPSCYIVVPQMGGFGPQIAVALLFTASPGVSWPEMGGTRYLPSFQQFKSKLRTGYLKELEKNVLNEANCNRIF